MSTDKSSQTTFYLNLCALVLGVFALLTFTGLVMRSRPLFTLGQSTGFAPMPMPFRELVPGSENINMVFSVVLQKGSEYQTYSSERMVEMFSVHQRPHRAAVPFYTLANYFIVVPTVVKKTSFTYMCKKMGGDTLSVYAAYAQRTYSYTVLCK